MIQPQATPTHDELEALFVNNEKLDRIATYLNRFNPIRTMRMERMEIRHSAILAWLLDPTETHGFGDRFLKAFLAEALRGRSGMGKPTALDVSQCDLRDAEIRREWQNIDIFILSRRNHWAFIIENKFGAKQREGQLSAYVAKVKAAFQPKGETLTVRGIFLTLLDEDPQDQSYVALRYSAICEILPRLIALEGLAIGQEVTTFLEHYLEVIRDAADMSDERNEMAELARQLYRAHKKVLDFVIEHGAGTDFILAAETLFGSNWEYGKTIKFGKHSYMYNWHNNWQFSFLPSSWREAFGGDDYSWPGCENWWAGYPLICWLHLREGDDGVSGTLKLVAEVGPISDHDVRKAMIEGIKAAADERQLGYVRFQNGADDEGKRYSRFFKKNSVTINDISDAEEIWKAMKALLEKFQPCFDAIAPILPGFTKFAEKLDD